MPKNRNQDDENQGIYDNHSNDNDDENCGCTYLPNVITTNTTPLSNPPPSSFSFSPTFASALPPSYLLSLTSSSTKSFLPINEPA